MTSATDTPLTMHSIHAMLGISRGAVTSLIRAGFVTPTRGPRNEYRFGFQDVVLLRTALDLRAAGVSPRRILNALRRLRATLPAELPLSGLRMAAVGDRIAVCERNAAWEAESGQLLLDLANIPQDRGPALRAVTPAAPGDAAALLARGAALESADPTGAEAAYRLAISIAPDDAAAYVNLGALLCESRRSGEALQVCDEATRHCPGEPFVYFNRAIALEDVGRFTEAVASYEQCLELAPDLADAHFNAARLHEYLGNAQRAVRHLSTYRRLQ